MQTEKDASADWHFANGKQNGTALLQTAGPVGTTQMRSSTMSDRTPSVHSSQPTLDQLAALTVDQLEALAYKQAGAKAKLACQTVSAGTGRKVSLSAARVPAGDASGWNSESVARHLAAHECKVSGDKVQHGLSSAKPSAPCAPLVAAVLYAKGAGLDLSFLADDQHITEQQAASAKLDREPMPAPLTDRGAGLPLGNGKK
jgi:hypothetical protein